MPEPQAQITETIKIKNCVAHVTVIGFDKERHQNIFNRKLAELLLKDSGINNRA